MQIEQETEQLLKAIEAREKAVQKEIGILRQILIVLKAIEERQKANGGQYGV